MIRFEWLNKNNFMECSAIRQKLFDYKFTSDIYVRIVNNDHIDKYQKIDYAIIKNGSNESIGTIGYYISKEAPDRCWIGWYGILSAFRGKGYGNQIMEAYIDFIKTHIKEAKFLNVYTNYDECAVAIHGYTKYGMILEENRFYKDGHSDKWCILGMSLDNNKYIEWNKEPIWCED